MSRVLEAVGLATACVVGGLAILAYVGWAVAGPPSHGKARAASALVFAVIALSVAFYADGAA